MLNQQYSSQPKTAIVVHSGGMDSSLCLNIAIRQHGRGNVLSLSFNYNERHSNELVQAKKICQDWQVDHQVVDISGLTELTENALTNHQLPIEHLKGQPPNTLVMARNGLFARLGAVKAQQLDANAVYLGVIEVEGGNSGYRDCSREYMDLVQRILRIDLENPHFEIVTPVIFMTKQQTMVLADQLGILNYLLEHTITCYEGIPHQGCGQCPACHLRNQGIIEFMQAHPDHQLPYNMPSMT